MRRVNTDLAGFSYFFFSPSTWRYGCDFRRATNAEIKPIDPSSRKSLILLAMA